MSLRGRSFAVAGLAIPLAVVAAITAGLVMGAPPARPPVVADQRQPTPTVNSPTPSGEPVAATPSPEPSVDASASPDATPTTADPLLGTDGRLTVLLLGSDYRPAHPGNRTDAVMVVSIDPSTGKSAAFSVPRDIVAFPLPGSGTFGAKITGLYQHLDSTMGNGGAGMKQAVSRAFGIEVDRYVLIGFKGVIDLVGAVGGVDVTLAAPYYDPYYWVNGKHRGWGLPAGRSHLNAADALIFARSRKGDSDFGRAKRQQMLVMAAVSRVRTRGAGDLPKLLKIARDTVRTDLPVDRAADVFSLVSTANLATAKRVVFGPKKFAVRAVGTDYRLVLDLCRQWIATNFPPARPFGTWPAS